MSAAHNQTSLESLQCHFTWDLDRRTSFLLLQRDFLEDIGTEEGNRWLGHIYNLRGFIQYKLGFTEDAKSLFNKAADAFKQVRNADEGPWLVVNYGNLAWLHHHLGEPAESQAYLSKVDALMREYPSPSQDELHPEIYAERAWTLMNFSKDRELVVDLFKKAIRMQPDMVEWNTSYVLGLVKTHNHSNTGVDADLLEKMRHAKEQDPENLYLAAVYLLGLGKTKETIEDEARELGSQVLRNPVSSYSGIRPLLRVYRHHISVDEAIDLAEEALKTHPDQRYLKRCVALCYKWKIMFFSKSRPRPGMMDRAISLHEEVVSLYPHSPLMKKIELASIYAKSDHSQDKAKEIYQELLQSDVVHADKQMLYNYYAKYLFFVLNESDRSVQYHMNAAEIPEKSFFRENSIRHLEKTKDRGRMCREIEEFLENLQEPTS
uniref:interferon-induced protein with tetratricopeptide repeats 1-like n=1 Tax=Semicossyphus pulcher TaxID=241346 RepID=UPI0037E9AB6B